MKKLFCVVAAFLSLVVCQESFAFNKTVGKGYCAIRHPAEAITSAGPSCESQHVIQQQSGGGDAANTIWINTTLHSYLDRSVCKPWHSERPAFAPLGDDNIERAYMMGVWANGYHFFMYDHHGDGTLTLTNWDGSTHLLYLISSVINLPQKEIGYLAYQIERYRKGQTTQFVDAAVGIVIDMVELAVGAVYSALGMIVGTIFNPLDTVRNLLSLVTLTITALFNAVWLVLKHLAALLSLGWIGSCGL